MNDKILEDLKLAMKSQDKFTLSVLRLLKSALQLESINKKRDLEDSEVIAVIKKQVKLRKDSITEFEKYNQLEKVSELEKEIAVLNKYLPEETPVEEIKKVIESVFSEVKPSGMKDMGVIMKMVGPKLPNADMSLVSQLIKEKLMQL